MFTWRALQMLPSGCSERLFPTCMASYLPAYKRVLFTNVKLRQLLLPRRPASPSPRAELSLDEAPRRAAHGRHLPIRKGAERSLAAE